MWIHVLDQVLLGTTDQRGEHIFLCDVVVSFLFLFLFLFLHSISLLFSTPALTNHAFSTPSCFFSLFSLSSPQSHACFTDTGRYPETAAYDNCALCIIRPHAVKAGHAGSIITSIQAAGMEVTALKMIHLARAESHELFEVYKGVLPYYSEIITEMISAPCIFMEVRSQNVVEDLRRLTGPHDVELAQHIMPDCMRAKYGVSNAKNGVHVTDLASDGELEVRYVFEILNRVHG